MKIDNKVWIPTSHEPAKYTQWKGGAHRGIYYDLIYTEGNKYMHGYWCAYVSIMNDQLSNEQFQDFWLNEKEEGCMGCNKKWTNAPFHCGITFYQRKREFISHPKRMKWIKIVKIGCDYNHCWDEPYFEADGYSKHGVERDIKKVIDELHAMYDFIDLSKET